jgi:hypothetical protein
MATQYNYGMKLKLPATGDKGSIWFPVLEYNIDKTNSHTHDGSNSSQILATSITAFTQNITAGAAWVNPVNGVYEQELTLPSGVFSDVMILVKDSSGNQLFIKVGPGSTTTKYKVYSNDTTLSGKAYVLFGPIITTP